MQLVIAEKPSVAQSIAKVLGADERKDGYMEGNGSIVSWCVGHLVELAQPDAYSDAWKKCPWNEASCTIKENHGGVNIHPKLPRVLTAREMARLQSFPDDFIFIYNDVNYGYKMIGNAVPVNLAYHVAMQIKQTLESRGIKSKLA